MKVELIKNGEEEKVSEICQKCIKEINAEDLTDEQVNLLLIEFSVEGITSYSVKYKVYVAKDENDEIIGTGTLAENQTKGVFVDTGQLGKGVGNFIIQFLENELKKSDYKKSFLTSGKYAKDFYLRLGYKKTIVNNSVAGEMTEMENDIQIILHPGKNQFSFTYN